MVCGHETDKVNDPCVFFVFSCLLDVFFEGGTMYTYAVIFFKLETDVFIPLINSATTTAVTAV